MIKGQFPQLFESVTDCKGIVVEFYSPTCGTVVVKDVASIYGEGDFREM